MKFIFILFLGLTILFSKNIDTDMIEKRLAADNCSKIEKFSDKQIEYIVSTYIWGKPYGLELMLPAISWQESCLGLYKLNMYDPSAGLFHAYLPSVMGRHKDLKDTPFNQNKIAQMLVNDDKFAASEAIAELLFWKNYYKENRQDFKDKNLVEFMLMSYNRGTRWHNSSQNRLSAENYYKSVKQRMATIETFITKYNIDSEVKKLYQEK